MSSSGSFSTSISLKRVTNYCVHLHVLTARGTATFFTSLYMANFARKSNLEKNEKCWKNHLNVIRSWWIFVWLNILPWLIFPEVFIWLRLPYHQNFVKNWRFRNIVKLEIKIWMFARIDFVNSWDDFTHSLDDFFRRFFHYS